MSSSRPLIVCLLLSTLLAAGCDRKSSGPEQANSATPANVTSGEVTSGEATSGEAQPGGAAPNPTASPSIDRSHAGSPAPTLTFQAPDGSPSTLAAFRGKPVLLNLWATWCAPCVKEMPTLDGVARDMAGRLTVLPVAQDLDPGKVAPFFASHGYGTLKPYTDGKLGLSLTYQANLPTSILYDAKGREVWRVMGGMDWSTPAARALLNAAG